MLWLKNVQNYRDTINTNYHLSICIAWLEALFPLHLLFMNLFVFDGGSDQLKTETYQLAGFHFVINWFFELIAGCTS